MSVRWAKTGDEFRKKFKMPYNQEKVAHLMEVRFWNTTIQKYREKRYLVDAYEDTLYTEFCDMIINLIGMVFRDNDPEIKHTLFKYLSMDMDCPDRARLMMMMMNRGRLADSEEERERKILETCNALTNWNTDEIRQELAKEYKLTEKPNTPYKVWTKIV